MSKHRMPKINSIHFGAAWIAISLVIGLLLPGVIYIFSNVFYWGLSLIGGIVLLGFIIAFIIEMRQDSGKKPYYERYLSEDIPFDPEKQIAVIKSSICTGEQVAGFKDKRSGKFEEIALIKNAADLSAFKAQYGIEGEIPKFY